VSRARARRALSGGWAVPREIASLAPSALPGVVSGDVGVGGRVGERGIGGGNSGGGIGGVKVVAAAGGFNHTALVTGDGKMYLFGEGAAVAGGDLHGLEGRGGGGVGAELREAGGLVRRRRPEEEGGEGDKDGLDPVAVSRGYGRRWWRWRPRAKRCAGFLLRLCAGDSRRNFLGHRNVRRLWSALGFKTVQLVLPRSVAETASSKLPKLHHCSSLFRAKTEYRLNTVLSGYCFLLFSGAVGAGRADPGPSRVVLLVVSRRGGAAAADSTSLPSWRVSDGRGAMLRCFVPTRSRALLTFSRCSGVYVTPPVVVVVSH